MSYGAKDHKRDKKKPKKKNYIKAKMQEETMDDMKEEC